MNPFLIYPVPSELPPKPRRLYTRLDDLENLNKAQSEFLLGGVDANWFDASGSLVTGVSGPLRLAGLEKMPVYLLEFQSGPPQDPRYPLSWIGEKRILAHKNPAHLERVGKEPRESSRPGSKE